VAANDYHFVTTWRLPGTAAEIFEVLGDAGGLARWWPSVYLEGHVIERGDAAGVGKVVDLWTKGWLPYTLRWRFVVDRSEPPHGFHLVASGDVVGAGMWTLTEERAPTDPGGPVTEVTYDWRIAAEKGLLRHFSPVLKPLFGANHRWAMARGEASLRLELARRDATTDFERRAIPEAPGPTFPHRRARAPDQAGWGRSFDPDRLARLELRMWQAYYRRQPARLFGLLVLGYREQARAGWPRALLASFHLARGAARFGRSQGDYERFLPDIVRGYELLGLPTTVDAEEVARRELRWWVVRREIGLSAGSAAGEAISRLYAAIYGLPTEAVAEAGRLRGEAAEVRDRGAAADPAGPAGDGHRYWPEVAKLLRASYRSLHDAVAAERPD
jgi:hypothetical protein